MERMTKNKRSLLTVLLEAAPSHELTAVGLGDATGIKAGSLYPALYQLVEVGLIEAAWRITHDQSRPERQYRLSPDGVLLAQAIRNDKITGVSWRGYLPAGEL